MRISFYVVLLMCFVLPSLAAIAQPGISEMHQVSTELRRTFFSAADAALVLAGLFGITGGIRIYNNWQMGKPHITTEVANWFYAAFFMVLAAAFLRAIYGI